MRPVVLAVLAWLGVAAAAALHQRLRPPECLSLLLFG